MIKYLFTNNKKIGSRAISWGSKYEWQNINSTPSHSGLLFFNSIVLHSNFNGVHIEPLYFFRKKNTLVCSIKRNKKQRSECECHGLFERYVKKAWGQKYDYTAIFYFTWRIFLKKLFNKPMPLVNKWESPNKWFCDELFEIELGIDASMRTPNDLMNHMLEHDDFDACEMRY